MSEEEAFLAGIRAQPADDLRRLVYADWLEEQGTDEARAKAEYLRLEIHIARLDKDHPERDRHIVRLKRRSELLTSYWKACVSKLPIERCAARWEFLCPKKWDELTETADALVRHCTACKKDVHYCTSIDDAGELVRTGGHCVVIDLRVRRREGDLPPPMIVGFDGLEDFGDDEMMYLGEIGPDFEHEPRSRDEGWLRRVWRKLTGR